MVDAALGLYHLHMHAVVHRDIAARNILIDDNYRAKVSDFGMARVAVDDEQGSKHVPSLARSLARLIDLMTATSCRRVHRLVGRSAQVDGARAAREAQV